MKTWLAGMIGVSAIAMAGAAGATTITFADFSSTGGLQLNGAAAVATDASSRQVLRLTNNLSQAGSAFSTTAISLAADASFSAKFAFNINNPINGGADGIVFVVQTVANNVGGFGGGIGYTGIAKSVGIEIDNWPNGSGFGDPDDNHVAVNTGGLLNAIGDAVSVPKATIDFDSSGDVFAWVDYNGATDLLEMRLATSDSRPATALIARTVDLAAVLETTDAFVGFTSGTGSAGANHDILSFEFRDTFAPVDVDPPTGVPAPASLALLGSAIAALGLRRRS
ncbi:MAG: PEP-CTERM sorting domain-containing protein [Alphaproteobacteria bacterium]|nr:PEP-CTERM sorting domain-containing protein [Alphaproteobacteria bacterium]